MNAVRATWTNGRAVPDGPMDWEEGSRLLIAPDPAEANLDENDREERLRSPEAIADWMAWYESLGPLVFTPEEEADFARPRREHDAEANAKRDRMIDGLFA